MTPDEYAALLYNQRLFMVLLVGMLAFMAGSIAITAYLYVRMVRSGEEALSILRLSRGLQSMTREHVEHTSAKLDHVDAGVSQVKTVVVEAAADAKQAAAAAAVAVSEVRQAAADASESGTRLRTLPPDAGSGT